jgi:hypothetical protein
MYRLFFNEDSELKLKEVATDSLGLMFRSLPRLPSGRQVPFTLTPLILPLSDIYISLPCASIESAYVSSKHDNMMLNTSWAGASIVMNVFWDVSNALLIFLFSLILGLLVPLHTPEFTGTTEECIATVLKRGFGEPEKFESFFTSNVPASRSYEG